jgi:putative membrane protein
VRQRRTNGKSNFKQKAQHKRSNRKNPESSFDEFKKIEVETVKKKMIKSKPFVPGISENSNPDTNVWGGVIGILIGMMMVGGLDYLREKS